MSPDPLIDPLLTVRSSTSRARENKKYAPLTEDERVKLGEVFKDLDPSWLNEEIELALSHDAHKKYPGNQFGYVRNWIRRGAPNAPKAPKHYSVPAPGSPWVDPEIQQQLEREDRWKRELEEKQATPEYQAKLERMRRANHGQDIGGNTSGSSEEEPRAGDPEGAAQPDPRRRKVPEMRAGGERLSGWVRPPAPVLRVPGRWTGEAAGS